MTQLYDILIVGAGPAGSFAAYRLAQAGFKTLVIDRATAISRKVCGEYLCPKGVELLAQEKLEEPLRKLFHPLNGMNIFTPNGRKVSTTFPEMNGVQQGLSLQRDVFDQFLVDLAQKAGARFQFGESIEGFYQESRDVVVRTSRGQYRAQVLLAADGRKSKVASLLGFSEVLKQKRVALHCFLTTPHRAERKGEMHLFSDGSYVGIDPTGLNEYNFSVVCDGYKVKELGGIKETLNHYIEKSADLRQRFKPLTPETPVAAVSPLQHRVSQVTAEKVALIGDASGFVDPLTGEGIYNALRTARLVSDELIKCRQAQNYNYREALLNYAREHKVWLRDKSRLNRVFQFIIQQPWIIENLGAFLSKNAHRADTFIGVVGNIYTPQQGLKKLLQAA